MRKSMFEPCTLCPALIEQENKPYCIFFDGEVVPEEDGCRHLFVDEDQVRTELLTIVQRR